MACPNGLKYDLFYYFNAGEEYENLTEHTDDIGFIEAVIDEMIENYPVDTSRVYIMGHSNGGIMAYRIAAELPYKVAAIASNSGPMVYEYPPIAPVPIIHIHGLQDPLIPYEGDIVGTVNVPSVETVIETWRLVNGCDPNPVEIYRDDSYGILGKRWDCPDGENDVELYTYAEGGHGWRYDNDGYSATQLFWDFLKTRRNPLSLQYNDNDSVSLSWTSFGTHYFYRVDYRDNLTSSEWNTVTPVSQFPINWLHWIGDNVGNTGMRFYKVTGIKKYIASVTPSTITKGSSDVTLTIIGHNTSWAVGNVSVDMGSYVDITSVDVVDTEQLSVSVNVDSEAEYDRYYKVVITTTEGERVIKQDALFISE